MLNGKSFALIWQIAARKKDAEDKCSLWFYARANTLDIFRQVHSFGNFPKERQPTRLIFGIQTNEPFIFLYPRWLEMFGTRY